jgi:hypothetical protein
MVEVVIPVEEIVDGSTQELATSIEISSNEM